MVKILVVDDDPVHLRLTGAIIEKNGFEVISATGGEAAIKALGDFPTIAAIILDLVMPDMDGMAVMENMARNDIKIPVIVQTARSSLDVVITAMRQGAMDFFVKPVAPERLIISLRNALKIGDLENCVRLDQNKRQGRVRLGDIITTSPDMERVLTLSAKAAKSNIPVLLEGETGVGKEIIARAIQGSSARAGKAFITVNCAAIPANLIESTLFGHKKGAFTDAVADHKGKFLEADGGTLFLDEIGELPPEAQVKLLRAIQEGEIEPVGGSETKKVDVRLISATNRRLLNLTKEGKFREDLFYRLNVFPIYVPPLRDRKEDIDVLAPHFIARLGAEAGRRVTGLAQASVNLLKSYEWPGNVRQLENAIYRAIVLTETSLLLPVDFPQIVAGTSNRLKAREISNGAPAVEQVMHVDRPASVSVSEPGTDPDDMQNQDRFISKSGGIQTLDQMESDLISFALQQHDGHMTKVALSLGIGRSTLYRKLKEYGLEPVPQNQSHNDRGQNSDAA